jgi:hypothetical protein
MYLLYYAINLSAVHVTGFSYSLAGTIRHHVAKHCAPWLMFKGEFVTAPLVICSLDLLHFSLQQCMLFDWSYFVVDGEVCKFTFVLPVQRVDLEE